MTLTFDAAFDRLMGHEGGYVNDPADPGGETNWGISKRSYPTVDIKTLTREGAAAIYRRDFWDVVDAPPALKFQVFDSAVNSGITTALRWLQQAVGVADDGHWGPHSAAALTAQVATADGLHDVALRFLAARLDFLTALKAWPTFGKGWTRRVAANLRYVAQDTN